MYSRSELDDMRREEINAIASISEGEYEAIATAPTRAFCFSRSFQE